MMSKKIKTWCRALAVALPLSLFLCEPVCAGDGFLKSVKTQMPSSTGCRFLETIELQLPFNAIALSKADRRVVEQAVSRAKKWPDVQIQAIVIAGAYIGERDLDVLQDRRGENVQAYLRTHGIRTENIYVEPKTLTDVFAHRLPDGTTRVNQVEIELSPICKGGDCSWMCDDPRLMPPSPAIK